MDSGYVAMSGSTASSATAAKDPFYVVKDKVQVLVKQLKLDYDKWKDLLENTNTSTNPDFGKASQAVKLSVKTIRMNLNDLSQTVAIVEKKRERFTNIDDEELASRKRFINDTKASVQDVQNTMTSERTKNKIKSDRLVKKPPASAVDRARDEDSNRYVEQKAQQAQLLEQKQDVVLDDMSAALARLGDVAMTIGTELESQDALLQDINDEMDEADDKMTMVMKKITKLLGTSDWGKLCCILVLFCLCILLGALVIYT